MKCCTFIHSNRNSRCYISRFEKEYVYASYQLAVAMILSKNDKILIAKRSKQKDFAPGIWELPSGRVEKGETIESALIREAREELSVEIEPLKIVDAYIFERNQVAMALLTYYCQFNGEIKLSQEHSEYRFVDPEQAKKYFHFPEQVKTIEKYLKDIVGTE